MLKTLSICFLAIVLTFYSVLLHAQEENNEVYVHGKRYLELNIKAKEKYNKRVEKQQEKVLNKLKKKEAKFAKKLKRKDSTGYAQYKNQTPTFDSISRLSKSKAAISKTTSVPNKAIDSLKGVKKFLEEKGHVTGEGRGKDNLNGYDNKLSQIGKDQQKNEQVSGLIDKRMSALKGLKSGSKAGKLKGLKGIEKQVFYSKGKMQAFKSMSDEPSKAEEKALEYLQGQEGFDDYLKDKTGMNDPNASVADLEKMGYQTKKAMTAQMQKKFGSALPEVQQGISKQIQDFDDKTKGLKDAKNKAKSAKSSLKKPSFNSNKPSFKVNRMRSLPLSQRIEKQFNWQTVRPSPSGEPAKFQVAAMSGYKHIERLTYGLGLAASFGLGQGWNDIHLSFDGIGVRTFASWELIYGFGAYAGYERTYKQAAFFDTKQETKALTPNNKHNTNIYSEAVVIGLTKKYRISDKWNGSMQLLYDIWWKDKGLRSPIQIRFATIKK